MSSIYDLVRVTPEDRAKLMAFLIHVEKQLPVRCIEARLTPHLRRGYELEPQEALAPSLATIWTVQTDRVATEDFKDHLGATQQIHSTFCRFEGLAGFDISLSASVGATSRPPDPVNGPDHFGDLPLVVSSRSRDYGIWTGSLTNLHPSLLSLPSPPTSGRNDAPKIPAFAHDLLAAILFRANLESRARNPASDTLVIYRPTDVLQALNVIAPQLEGQKNRAISSFLSETLITGGRSRGPQMVPTNDSRRLKSAMGSIENLYQLLKTSYGPDRSIRFNANAQPTTILNSTASLARRDISLDADALSVWDADRSVAINFERLNFYSAQHTQQEELSYLSL